MVLKIFLRARENPNHDKILKILLGCVETLTIKKILKIFFGPMKTLMITNFLGARGNPNYRFQNKNQPY